MVEGTRRTIQECLESEVGALAGGGRGQALRRVTTEEVGKLLDGRGKPKGRYKEVLARCEEMKADTLPTVRQRQREIAADLDGLQAAEEELRRATATNEDEIDRKVLIDAQAEREAALRLVDQLKTADTALSLAQTRARQAEEEVGRRHQIIDAINAATTAVARTAEAQADANAKDAQLDTEAGQLRKAVQESETSERDIERMVQNLRATAELVRLDEEARSLDQALTRAQAAQARVNELIGRLDAIKIDQAGLARIQKVVRQQQSKRAELQALATRVAFEIDPAALAKITVNERPLLASDEQLNLVDETRIAITGIGQITIQPVIRDRDELDRDLRNAERSIESLLRAAGAADAEEAETKFAERQHLTGQIEIAKAEVQAYAPARSGLDPGPAVLATHVERLRARLSAGMVELNLSQLPAREDVERELVAALAQSQALSARIDEARGASAVREGALRDARTASAKAQAEYAAASAELERRRRELEATITTENDEDLAIRHDAARQALTEANAERIRFARAAEDANPELIAARIERLTAKQTHRRDRIETLRSVVQGHRIRIGEREGEGIDERIAQAERELAQLEEERAFSEREVRLLQMLDAELEAAERGAKERYMAPVVTRIRPYLQQLLPGASIACDENFSITAILRDGKPPEFDRQSGGTQEQIAVLTRLAFAELLVDRGKPATVILDDALVYSDPHRMERMFDILTHAAHKTQIVILSCREALFEGLGARRLTIEEL